MRKTLAIDSDTLTRLQQIKLSRMQSTGQSVSYDRIINDLINAENPKFGEILAEIKNNKNTFHAVPVDSGNGSKDSELDQLCSDAITEIDFSYVAAKTYNADLSFEASINACRLIAAKMQDLCGYETSGFSVEDC